MYGGLGFGQPLGYLMENLVRPFQNTRAAEGESVGHPLREHITSEPLGLGARRRVNDEGERLAERCRTPACLCRRVHRVYARIVDQPAAGPGGQEDRAVIASAGCNTVGDGAVQYRANGSHRFAPPPSFATTIAKPSPFSALASTIAGVDETFFSLSSTTTGSRNSNRGSRCTRSSRV
jgi:hypothetical protein